MQFSLCLEQMEGRWVAYVPNVWGCFTSGDTPDEAVANAPQAIVGFWNWLRQHRDNLGELAFDLDYNPPEAFWLDAPKADLQAESITVTVIETQAAYETADEYEVNAFFAHDQPPLTGGEVMVARQMLTFTRADLLDALLGLSKADFDREFVGEKRTIRNILKHVATGENWYLDRFGLSMEAAWEMADYLGMLTLTRQQLLDVLPLFVDRAETLELEGERWTARKVLRRALWHERDHTQHIWALRKQISHKS